MPFMIFHYYRYFFFDAQVKDRLTCIQNIPFLHILPLLIMVTMATVFII